MLTKINKNATPTLRSLSKIKFSEIRRVFMNAIEACIILAQQRKSRTCTGANLCEKLKINWLDYSMLLRSWTRFLPRGPRVTEHRIHNREGLRMCITILLCHQHMSDGYHNKIGFGSDLKYSNKTATWGTLWSSLLNSYNTIADQ